MTDLAAAIEHHRFYPRKLLISWKDWAGTVQIAAGQKPTAHGDPLDSAGAPVRQGVPTDNERASYRRAALTLETAAQPRFPRFRWGGRAPDGLWVSRGRLMTPHPSRLST